MNSEDYSSCLSKKCVVLCNGRVWGYAETCCQCPTISIQETLLDMLEFFFWGILGITLVFLSKF